MPHIYVTGCDMTKNIQFVNVHVEVMFSDEYFKSGKSTEKLKELREEMEVLIEKYFPNYTESEILTNHEWNIKMRMK